MDARRWLGLLILIMIAALGGLVSAAGHASGEVTAPTIALVAAPGSWPPGVPIDVELRVSGAHNLGAFELDLQYDRARLALTGVTPGTLLGTTAGCNAAVQRCAVALGPREKPGAVALGAYSYGMGAGASQAGVLAVLHFRSAGKGGAATLHLANVKITDTHAIPTIPATRDATLLTEARLLLPLIRR